MENNILLVLLDKANNRDKTDSATQAEAIQRYYDEADGFGKIQIDKVLKAICNHTIFGLNMVADTEKVSEK